MQHEDSALVEQARSDPRAFGILYDRHVHSIYRFAYARLHNAAGAEDVTADVFVKALRGLGGYRDHGLPFSCWLYQIARNAVADHYRHQPAEASLPEDWSHEAITVEEQAAQRDDLRRLWQLINRLPSQQRTAMVLRFRDDRDLKDVGRIMGKSEAAAKLLIFRAVQRIRAEVALAGLAATA